MRVAYSEEWEEWEQREKPEHEDRPIVPFTIYCLLSTDY